MIRPKAAQSHAQLLLNDNTPNMKLFLSGRFDRDALKEEIEALIAHSEDRMNRVSRTVRSRLVELRYFVENGKYLKYVRWEKVTYAPWAENIPKG
jgi:hypothetical protein